MFAEITSEKAHMRIVETLRDSHPEWRKRVCGRFGLSAVAHHLENGASCFRADSANAPKTSVIAPPATVAAPNTACRELRQTFLGQNTSRAKFGNSFPTRNMSCMELAQTFRSPNVSCLEFGKEFPGSERLLHRVAGEWLGIGSVERTAAPCLPGPWLRGAECLNVPAWRTYPKLIT